MDKSLIVALDAPQIRENPELYLVGMGEDCNFETTEKLPALWQRFNARVGEITQIGDRCAYGVCVPNGPPGHFHYIAAVAADRGAAIPDGMEDITLAARRHAVFLHKGHISDFGKTVYTIWNKALAEHGLDPQCGVADFERYDHRFNAETGRGEVEIWVPVK